MNWNATMIHQDQAVIDFPLLTGAGESVVVIDTGAYTGHPSLVGKSILWEDFLRSSSTPVDADAVTTYAYDSYGDRTSVTDALNHQTTFAYDAGDRLTTITYPGGTITSTFAYDHHHGK